MNKKVDTSVERLTFITA